MMGLHRFLHTLDIFGSEPPAIPFAPDQIDAGREAADRTGATTTR
jgi:hypothetical protein